MYADDSNLKITSNTLEETEIQCYTELENIGNYLKEHNLLLNLQKTNYVQFKTAQNKNQTEPVVMCNSHLIKSKTITHFLGLSIDQNLNWNSHINNVLTKINSGIYALKKMSFYCDAQTLRNIYFSYIHSHISFGICLFGATTKNNLDNILKQQKRALRIILKLKYNDSVREHFKNLKILTVYGQYILDTILMFKSNRKETYSLHPIHKYNTRNKENITLTHHRTQFYQKKTNSNGK